MAPGVAVGDREAGERLLARGVLAVVAHAVVGEPRARERGRARGAAPRRGLRLTPALQGMQMPRTWGAGFDYTARPQLGRARPFAEDLADEDPEPQGWDQAKEDFGAGRYDPKGRPPWF